MSAEKNKILISGYYGFNNFGDELILKCLSDFLKQNGYQPVALSNNPEQTQSLHNIEAIKRTNIKSIINTLAECKAFISGGGGLFQDRTSFKSPLYYGALINLAYWAQVPTAFWGQGLGPLNGFIGQWITTESLKTSKLIVLRDLESKLWAESQTQKTVYLMADPVWQLQVPNMVTTENRKGLSLSLRPDIRLTQAWLHSLAMALSKHPIAQQEGINLIVAQEDEDPPVFDAFKYQLNQINPEIKTTLMQGISDCIQALSNSKVSLCMRLHAGIVSALAQTPTSMINYDPKVLKMAEAAGLNTLSLSTDLSQLPNFKTSNNLENLRENATIGYHHLVEWLKRI